LSEACGRPSDSTPWMISRRCHDQRARGSFGKEARLRRTRPNEAHDGWLSFFLAHEIFKLIHDFQFSVFSPVFYLLQFLNCCIIDYYVTKKLHKIAEKFLMESLNKWNQREIYSEILMVDFHVMCQIMDYPLKLMRIYLRTL
jgi:hypothetical protein